jgi:hydroxymethylpyrimidine/phosphomethylpyrimidine kinase
MIPYEPDMYNNSAGKRYAIHCFIGLDKAVSWGCIILITMKKKYHRVLTIAGSDSGGGAGIQADIKAISAMGCYAASAITAITVQNTIGVQAVHPIPLDILVGQIDAVLSDIGADAIKIGMLHSAEVVNIVAEKIEQYGIRNVVLDPVMVSTSGHRLMEEKAVEVIKERLIPLARVLTPNVPEAEILIGRNIVGECNFEEVAKELAHRYHVSVLLKAGHLSGDVLTDYFYNIEDDTLTLLPSKRVETRNTHGTGCTLSSAFASAIAKNEQLTRAAQLAKKYIEQAIIAGADYEIGHGHGPVNHFFEFT